MNNVKKKVNKKVVKKVVMEKVRLGAVVGSNNRGIGEFIRNSIIDTVMKGEAVDVKKLDAICFEKFGLCKVNKRGIREKSRVNSIRWHLNEMKDMVIEREVKA